MTDSPSEVTQDEAAEAAEEAAEEPSPAARLAARYAEMVGSDTWTADHGTPTVLIPRERWVEAHRILRDELPFFSWLSAIHWTAEVAVGEPPADEELEERYEIISRLSDVSEGNGVILSTLLPPDDAVLETIIGVFGGADWHERETAEMFGIQFDGHPNLVKIYLPDGFEGHPLRKTFPLLSREVKPWPGTVDVENMPSTENPEADGGES